MEPVEGEVRVPRDWIKRLEHCTYVQPEYDMSIAEMKRMFAEGMAYSIVNKLVEFNKIEVTTAKDGVTKCFCAIEVIVPHGRLYGA